MHDSCLDRTTTFGREGSMAFVPHKGHEAP
jgi:hypothetical protein